MGPDITARVTCAMLRHLLIVLCVLLAPCAPQTRDESLDQYLDLVLDNVSIMILENGLDPAPLPNGTREFSDSFLGIEYHGEASVYNGCLRGLASIYRSDNADFIYDPEGRPIGMKAGVGLREMMGYYNVLVNFMDEGPDNEAFLDVDGAAVYFEASLDQVTCKFQTTVLDVTNIGKIDVDIVGGLVSWIIEIVAEFVIFLVKGTIEDLVEHAIFDLMNAALGTVDLGPTLSGIFGCQKSNDGVFQQLVQPRALPLNGQMRFSQCPVSHRAQRAATRYSSVSGLALPFKN